jgi:DHA1 family tetracycline resistance protein-like MFS transporter
MKATIEETVGGATGPTSRPRGRQAAFGFIFAASVMNALSFGLMIPVLPNLIRSFFGATNAASTASAADWQAVFGVTWGLMQFISGPILGMLSDRFGRRPVLLISIFGLSLDFLVMAFAPTLSWLLVGRVLSGATSATFSTANAYVADVSTPDRRARNFGIMSSAFSIGFLFGPVAGGILAVHPLHFGAFHLDGLRTPFLVAALLCAVNWFYGLLVLPESLAPERRMTAFQLGRANPVGSLALLRSHRDLLPLAAISFLFSFSQQVLPNIFVLYTTLRYNWNQEFLGVTFFITGALGVTVQLFVVGPVVRWIGERGAVLVGAIFGTAGFLIFAWAPSGAAYFVGMPIFALQGLMMPGLNSLMSQHVSPSEQGRLQGANQSLMGIANILGPLVFPLSYAFALRSLPALPGLPILISAGLLSLAVVLSLRFARPEARLTSEPAT